MSHIFISYSRVDIVFAGKIVQTLAENNLDTWIDWKSIPKGEDWEQEIYRGIEEADAFLFLISPDSVASQMCNKEIVHAVENGKRILPIVIRDTDPKNIHSEISKRNWIFCRDGQDDFDKAIEETRNTIYTDYEWLKYHTELQVKALKWEQKKDNSRLLRGKELREAEQQLAKAGSQKDPQPTELHRNYLLACLRNEVQQRRQITFGLSIVLIIVATLALFAWNQRNDALNSAATAIAEENARATAQANAEQQARIAEANYLASLSQTSSSGFPQRRILLALEALKLIDNGVDPPLPTVKQAILDALKSSQGLTLQQPAGVVTFSHDDSLLAVGQTDGIINFYDLTYENYSKINQVNTGRSISSLQFSPDGVWLSVESDSGFSLWRESDGLTKSWSLIKRYSGLGKLRISSDSKVLVSASSTQVVMIKLDIFNEESRIDVGKTITDLQIDSRTQSIVIVTEDGYIGFLEIDHFANDQIMWKQIASIPVDSLLLNHQGSLLVTATKNKIKVWSVDPGSNSFTEIVEIGNMKVEDTFSEVRMSENGKWLTYVDGLYLYAKNLFQPDLPAQEISFNWSQPYSISPNDEKIVVYPRGGSYTGILNYFDMIDFSGKQVGATVIGNEGFVNHFYFSHYGRWLVTSGESGIRIYDFYFSDFYFYSTDLNKTNLGSIYRNGDHFSVKIKNYKSNNLPVISRNGNWLILPSGEKVFFWDAHKSILGPPSKVFENGSEINLLYLSPDGKRLVLGSIDGKIKLWDWEYFDFEKSFIVSGFQGTATQVAMTNDNNWLAIQNDSGVVYLWDVSQNYDTILPIRYDNVSKFSFSSDDNYMFLNKVNNEIAIYRTNSGSSPQLFSTIAEQSSISKISFISRDRNWLFTMDANSSEMNVWMLDEEGYTRQQITNPYLKDTKAFEVSVNGKYLATIHDNNLYIWDLGMLANNGFSETTQPVYTYENDFYLTTIGFTPSETKIAFASSKGIHVYNLTNHFSNIFVSSLRRFISKAILTDNQLLLASDDGANIWNLNYPEYSQLNISEAIGGAGTIVNMSDNGQWMISTRGFSKVDIWNFETDHLIKIACNVAGRNLTIREWQQYIPGESYRATCPQWPAGE